MATIYEYKKQSNTKHGVQPWVSYENNVYVYIC